MNVDIGGTTVATDYDQLVVNGAATLSGTLNISLINSYVPDIGASFTIMTYTSKTGSFATTNLPALPSGKKWNATYGTTSITLSVQSTTVSWASAVSGNWSDGSKWTGGVAPTSVDDVLITVAGDYTVNFNNDATVNSLTLGGTSGTQTLANSGKTLTLTNASTINSTGVLSMSGAFSTLTGAGTLTVNGALNWSNGTMSGTGSTNIAPGGTLAISVSVILTQRTLENNGTVTHSGGALNFYTGAVVNNAGTWNVLFDGGAFAIGGGAAPAFNNSGTLAKTGGTGTTTIGVPFYNSGSVNVSTGTISLVAGGRAQEPLTWLMRQRCGSPATTI